MTDRRRYRREPARAALSLMLLGVLLCGTGAALAAGAGPRLVADDLGTVPAAAGPAAAGPAGVTGGAPLRPTPASRVLPVLARPDVAAAGAPAQQVAQPGRQLAGEPGQEAAQPDRQLAGAPDGAALPGTAPSPAAGAAPGPPAVAAGPSWRPGELRAGAAPRAAATGPDRAGAPDAPRPGGTGPATLAPKLPWTVSPIHPAPAGPDPSAPPRPVVPAVLELPERGITAPVEPVGTGPGGGMVIPEQVRTVGWWAPGALPGGAAGSSVIAGHVDSAVQGVGVLAVLPQLTTGERVVVRGPEGRAAAYRVAARRAYGKRDLPREVFRRDGDPQLVLITCGGTFDPAAGSYESNIVVYAVPEPA